MMRMSCFLCQLQLCTSACQHLSQDKPYARVTASSLVTRDVWGRQRRYATAEQYSERSNLRAGRRPRAPPRSSSQELFVFPTSAVCYRIAALLRSIWTFYGDVIYVASWHVNDARDPCLPSIFMNNCVRGSGRDGGDRRGGGAATRPPKVSRARSLGGGAAEASGSHACRHWPTCSSRLVAFPERRSIESEQRNMPGCSMGNCQISAPHTGRWLPNHIWQHP